MWVVQEKLLSRCRPRTKYPAPRQSRLCRHSVVLHSTRSVLHLYTYTRKYQRSIKLRAIQYNMIRTLRRRHEIKGNTHMCTIANMCMRLRNNRDTVYYTRVSNTGLMTKRRHQYLHLQSLTISFLNVCSIRYKLDEIRDFIASRGVSIFAVAETW